MREQKSVHVYELVQVELEATVAFENPYTDVEVWVDLRGPGFAKRVHGFWDGGNRFVVRLVAPRRGTGLETLLRLARVVRPVRPLPRRALRRL